MSIGKIFADDAQKYTSLSWAIFPLADGEKIPFAGSDGFKSSSSNRAQIAVWAKQHPHANIGVATGKLSGIIVIDIDVQNGGPESVARLAQNGKVFHDTVEASTPSGGRHLFYAYDKRVVVGGTHKLGRGIDIKTDGGYVVAAPSFWRKTGTFYKWVRPPRGGELPKLPKWVIEALQPKPQPKVQPMRKLHYANLQGYQRQAMADLDEAVRRMATLTDGRHEAPFKMASWLGPYVHNATITEKEVRQSLLWACQSNGFFGPGKYSRGDFEGQITRGMAKSVGKPLPPLTSMHSIAWA